jgi:hypothetical protein
MTAVSTVAPRGVPLPRSSQEASSSPRPATSPAQLAHYHLPSPYSTPSIPPRKRAAAPALLHPRHSLLTTIAPCHIPAQEASGSPPTTSPAQLTHHHRSSPCSTPSSRTRLHSPPSAQQIKVYLRNSRAPLVLSFHIKKRSQIVACILIYYNLRSMSTIYIV